VSLCGHPMPDSQERGHRPLEYADDRQDSDSTDERDLLRGR